ncbi:MAG: transcriptional regulator MntR [Firmicutes bacterium]|nr:transcriptional regulator MntR [Alicyclobacillaceae bacterium]MCL6497643.1 transcriptional regulator MntR [Bacillota bacterium]
MATPSQEDYLEVICRLVQEKGYARVRDIAEALQISLPSVSKMIRRLNQDGLLEVERYRGLTLTAKGLEQGGLLVQRHRIVERFLRNLGVTDEAAVWRDVEGMEHFVGPATLARLNALNAFIEANPSWWRRYLDTASVPDAGRAD